MKNIHKSKIDEAFAKRFRTLMSNRNLKLKDIAKASGSALSTVSTWKRGQIPKSQSRVDALCKIFNVSGEYLYNGTRIDGEPVFSNEKENCIFQLHSQKRMKIEAYFEKLANAAEKIEGGLEHLHYELLNKIPLETYAGKSTFQKYKKRA